MTSLLARPICRAPPFQKRLWFSMSHKQIHTTPIAYKKKGKVALDDDLFEDAFIEEELVKAPSTTYKATHSATPGQPETTSEQATTRKAKKRSTLSPSIRLERLNALLSFTEKRIGRVPELSTPLVRRRSWLTMLDLAANEEQVQRIVDFFATYKSGPGEFPKGFAEAFTRRCQELSCPQLSLKVFGNFPKHKLALTLPAGRWLIHSLHVQHPIASTLLAASFYPAYGLPNISEDLPSAAMVAAACYSRDDKTEETVKIAEALFPNIRTMWNLNDNETIGTAKSSDEARVNQWLASSLKRLNHAVNRENGGVIVPTEAVPTRIVIERPSSTTHLNVRA